MSNPYDDILYLPRPQSPARRRMPMIQRAAQFSPFAALTGYEDAIREEARLTDYFIQPGEEDQAVLDARLRLLMAAAGEQPAVSVTWFRPDEKKTGGQYVRTEGRVKKIRTAERELLLMDGTAIPLDAVSALEGPIFSRLETSHGYAD